MASNHWAEFYAERRLAPLLRSAIDSGHLPLALVADIEHLQRRLPTVCGPEPQPTLLHGEAQQNSFISTDAGAVVIDAAPHFGHPEIDLALVDYFQPVPDDVFDAYREITIIDPGFTERRDLWRTLGYLAVVTVDGDNPFGRPILAQLDDIVRRYRLTAEPTSDSDRQWDPGATASTRAKMAPAQRARHDRSRRRALPLLFAV